MSDAERLKRLYDQRVPTGMSQAEFGSQFGIGTKAMVWQYLKGYRPLNYDAAAKFARGLRCTIAEISPDLARRIKLELFPLVGKVSVKVALALIFTSLLALLPGKPAEAATRFNIILNTHWRRITALFGWRRERVSSV